MKRNTFFTTMMFLLVLPLSARASNWTLDPDHSTAQFKGRHLMISNV